MMLEGLTPEERACADSDFTLPEAADLLAAVTTERGAGELRDRLQCIGERGPETGHVLVESVLREALQMIANGHADAAWLARVVLTIESADFPRWYA